MTISYTGVAAAATAVLVYSATASAGHWVAVTIACIAAGGITAGWIYSPLPDHSGGLVPSNPGTYWGWSNQNRGDEST